jgi:hypothetical protein
MYTNYLLRFRCICWLTVAVLLSQKRCEKDELAAKVAAKRAANSKGWVM